MRALVWHGKEDIRCDTVTDPEIEHPRDAIVKVTSCAICGSDLHLFHNFIPAMMPGDIMGHEMMGEVVEVGSGVNGQAQEGRPHRRAVHHLVRRVRAVQARQLLGLRDDQPQEGARRQSLRARDRGPVRLHASHRRISGRPGRISPRSLRRHDAHQGAGQPHGRAGAVPRRHLPDRMAGGCPVRHSADGHRSDLGLRSRRSDGDPQRDPPWCQAGDRHRRLPERLRMAKRVAPPQSISRRTASSRASTS